MRCREKRKRIGDVLPFKGSFHYPLPRGLAAGTLVRLVSYDHGYWTVEASGELYRVFGTLVDAGFEYELNGRWLAADDPRVITAKTAWKSVTTEAPAALPPTEANIAQYKSASHSADYSPAG